MNDNITFDDCNFLIIAIYTTFSSIIIQKNVLDPPLNQKCLKKTIHPLLSLIYLCKKPLYRPTEAHGYVLYYTLVIVIYFLNAECFLFFLLYNQKPFHLGMGFFFCSFIVFCWSCIFIVKINMIFVITFFSLNLTGCQMFWA